MRTRAGTLGKTNRAVTPTLTDAEAQAERQAAVLATLKATLGQRITVHGTEPVRVAG